MKAYLSISYLANSNNVNAVKKKLKLSNIEFETYEHKTGQYDVVFVIPPQNTYVTECTMTAGKGIYTEIKEARECKIPVYVLRGNKFLRVKGLQLHKDNNWKSKYCRIVHTTEQFKSQPKLSKLYVSQNSSK